MKFLATRLRLRQDKLKFPKLYITSVSDAGLESLSCPCAEPIKVPINKLTNFGYYNKD